MPKTLQELKSLWNKEKKYYQSQEMGTGVQRFVKEMLRSCHLFDLKESRLSKKPELRKMEFIHEKKTKGGRQADFVIYIDQNIVIPVEVEAYGKIEAGVSQLFNYQRDLDKKYGILTDGNKWRFYTDNVYRSFHLSDIFKNPALFLEYWQEYIKPETYYLQFFEEQGQRSLIQEELFVEDYRSLFFDDITQLIVRFKNKLRLEGYFNGVDKKEKDKRATEITYAYIIQFILYKTLVDNDFGFFSKDYEQIVNIISKHIIDRKYGKILGIIDNISAKISKNIYRPFAEEQEFIGKKLLKLYRQPENKLSEVSPWMDIFVFIKKFNFQNVRNEIFGFIYENYLKELFEKEKKGQYFTDPAVVNFMIQLVGYSAKHLRDKLNKGQLDKLSIIDPACGSGTFLYSAVKEITEAMPNGSQKASQIIEKIVTKNVFGLDIEEFPLYLAEMNIIMRLLPFIITEKYNNPIDKKIKVFKTKDSIAEFVHGDIIDTKYDIDTSQGQRKFDQFPPKKLHLGYDSYVRDEDDLAEMKQSMRPPRRRFDFVIGNPPYVGYNQCSKQGLLTFELLKQREIKLNNIYKVNLHSIPGKPKKYRPNPNLYAFFIALGLSLLKDKARLCYIIPQTILTAGDLDVIRYHLAKYTTIEKIITFSGRMFVGRGLKQTKAVPTSSLIFVARREIPKATHQVQIINYLETTDNIKETLDNILCSKKIDKKKIDQSQLLDRVNNWNFIKHAKPLIKLYESYQANTLNINIYYEHLPARHHFNSTFCFDSGYSIDEKRLLLKPPEGDYYLYPKIQHHLWNINKWRGFWPNIRTGTSPLKIKLRQANQGYSLLDSKYKILWSYANPKKFHFSSLPLIWARNQICAIGSQNKAELLYLLALLNSALNQLIIHSNLKNETEKDLLVPTSFVKKFIRVPKITDENTSIKQEIIQKVEEMIDLEKCKLKDFVDFRDVLVQKFDNAKATKNHLLLTKSQKQIKLKIKNRPELVKRIIDEIMDQRKLELKKEKIRLGDLKETPAIDFELIDQIKDYLDDLVFSLYLNIPLKQSAFKKAQDVKTSCRKNKFYKTIYDYWH